MVDHSGYLLWLVSQVWVCLVSAVGVICVITAVFVFINYSRLIFLEVLACIYLVGFIVMSFRYICQSINYRITNVLY